MPLTDKGKRVLAQLVAEYGKEKAKEVFYAMINSGKLTGVEAGKSEGFVLWMEIHNTIKAEIAIDSPGSFYIGRL